jgi:hypothetical protein
MDFYAMSYIQGQCSMCPTPRIPFFLVHECLDLEATRLGLCIGSYETSFTRKPCAKAVPETDSLTQQKLLNVSSTTEPIRRRIVSVVELTFDKSVIPRVCTVGLAISACFKLYLFLPLHPSLPFWRRLLFASAGKYYIMLFPKREPNSCRESYPVPLVHFP